MRVDPVILDAGKTLRTIVTALGRRLTFQDNIQSVVILIEDSGPADTPIPIVHKLGKIPTGYIANGTAGYWNDVDRINWTDVTMELKCSAPNTMTTLVVF